MPDPRRPRLTADRLRRRHGGGPVSYAAALAAGVTRGQVRAAVAAGHLVVLRRGVLLPAATLAAATDPYSRHLLDARGLAAQHPSPVGAFSHATAVVVHDLPYPGLLMPPRWRLELTDDHVPAGRGNGWFRRQALLPDHHVTVRSGLDVTTLLRTVVDIALTRGPADAMPVADAGLRRLVLASADEQAWWIASERQLARDPALVAAARSRLLATLDEVGPPAVAIRRARRTLTWADPAAENGFESVSRAHLLLGGLPAPEVGYPVRGDDGRTYWADLAWPELRVLAEADGRLKYGRPEALYAEKRRQEALERAGWIVVRWTWDELLRTPEVVVARVLAALDRATARTAA